MPDRRGRVPPPDVAPSLAGGSPAGFAQRLEQWVADARVDDAALQRTRERWLEAVAAQEATLAGVLGELAERGTSVSLRTSADRTHHGVVQVIGADFVALRTPGGIDVLLAHDAIGVVRTAPTPDALGDRAVATDLRLVAVLTELAADRERVMVVTHNGSDSVRGALRSVGQDLVTLRTEGDSPAAVYVRLSAIGEVTIL